MEDKQKGEQSLTPGLWKRSNPFPDVGNSSKAYRGSYSSGPMYRQPYRPSGYPPRPVGGSGSTSFRPNTSVAPTAPTSPRPPSAAGQVQRGPAPVPTSQIRCFNCHSYGHYTKDCRSRPALPSSQPSAYRPPLPRGNQPQGRMYALSDEEAEASTEVVAGTF